MTTRMVISKVKVKKTSYRQRSPLWSQPPGHCTLERHVNRWVSIKAKGVSDLKFSRLTTLLKLNSSLHSSFFDLARHDSVVVHHPQPR